MMYEGSDRIRYPDLITLIRNNYTSKNFLKKIKKFLWDHFKIKNEKEYELFLFKSKPQEFKSALFGQKSHGLIRDRLNNSDNDKQCQESIQAGNFVEGSTKCWICDNIIEVQYYKSKPGKYKNNSKPECEHIFPVLRAVMFTGLLLTAPYQSQTLGKVNPVLAQVRHENYLWSDYCCNRGKNDDVWFTYSDGHFRADTDQIKKSLLNISKKKKCKTITPETLPIRAEKIEEIMDYKCGFLDNEIDEIRIQFTPTVEHSQLWTCYIFYLICIAQLSDINNKDQQEFDTFINRIKGTKLKFGKNNEELLGLMQEYKYKIFKLKNLIRYSRLYGEENILNYSITSEGILCEIDSHNDRRDDE